MRRSIAKYATLFVAFIAALHAFIDAEELILGHLFDALGGLLFSGGIAWFAWRRYQSFRAYQAHTYDWYIQNYPPRTVSRPECLKCGSSFMRTRRLMRFTFTQEHSCGTCGTRLYYSEER